MIKGKQGRFRQNLLGKRVDYSGRSVIVVGPELKLYQCGLPKEMALELFRPFVMKKLVEDKLANNIKSAKKMVDRGRTEVWDALDTIITEHPVLLNRAPTLHRLGIQAFEPVLVEGRAIKLHPLVCTAYNADFDGDQMAVHVPLSAEAQAEARFLMLAAGNLLKPSDGKPVVVPTQDMVLGSYYLTMVRENEIGAGKVFRDFDEARMAYSEGAVSLHAPIKVRVSRTVDGEKTTRLIDATVGRIIFNDPIPQDLGYVNRRDREKALDLEISFLVRKGELAKIIERCIAIHGTARTAEVLDQIKAQGFKYSTRGAITVAITDAVIPAEKAPCIEQAEKRIEEIKRQYERGFISEEVRYERVIKTWNDTTQEVKDALQRNFDRDNPIFIMADSGARGSMDQIRQLAGMRGLIANTSGRAIEIPIRSNYPRRSEHLEYFNSSRGAGKDWRTPPAHRGLGLSDPPLVDVAQDVSSARSIAAPTRASPCRKSWTPGAPSRIWRSA
jgi:DNA-directed RNA polymerase subunit beta'